MHKSTSYADKTDSYKIITQLDGLGREIIIYRAKGNLLEDQVEAIRYNAAGLVQSRNNWTAKKASRYRYESVFLNRLDSIYTPIGEIAYKYETNNSNVVIDAGIKSYNVGTLQKTTVTDVDGNDTSTYTDYLGNTVLNVGAVGTLNAETKYLYNDKVQLTKVFPPKKENSVKSLVQGKVYEYIYNERDLLEAKAMPSSSSFATYTYDEYDRLHSKTDYNGNKTYYKYNKIDMLVKTGFGPLDEEGEIMEGNELSEYQFSKNGNKTYKTWLKSEAHRILDDSGTKKMLSTNYSSYDLVGRPRSITKSGIFPGKTDTYNFTYNDLGQIKTKTVKIATPTGTAPTQNWEYNYDAYNRPENISYNNKLIQQNMYDYNNQLLSTYIEPDLTANTSLQAIDYSYNDDAKRLTGINEFTNFERRTNDNKQALNCKISFELELTTNGDNFEIKDIYFTDANAKAGSLKQSTRLNFPYKVTENNNSNFIDDLKTELLNRGYIFNDVFFTFGKVPMLHFEQTNFIAQKIDYNNTIVNATVVNCCFEGLTGSAIVVDSGETPKRAGKQAECSIPVVTQLNPYSYKPIVYFKFEGAANNIFAEYKLASSTTWLSVPAKNSQATLNTLSSCKNYQVRIKVECGEDIVFSAIQQFKSFGCAGDCEFDSFDADIRNITANSALITFSNLWGANYIFCYRIKGQSQWKRYPTNFPYVVLFGLEENAEYEFYVKANCEGKPQITSTIYTFTAQASSLLQVNAPPDLFFQTLNYSGSNIDTLKWQTLERHLLPTKSEFRYAFTYDNLNRIETANDFSLGSDDYSISTSYDLRGNLKTLLRAGPDAASIGGAQIDNIDDLNYKYDDYYDRLLNITDNADSKKGFTFKPDLINPARSLNANSYTYFDDGSIKKENAKGLTYYYNHINMLQKIEKRPPDQIDPIGTTKITYLANGEKLSMKSYSSGNLVNEVYYRDGTEIRNGNVIVSHNNGRIAYTNGSGAGNYQYYLKDHLGNVRLTFSDKNNDGKASTNEVIAENHYYPFGLKMEGSWNSNNTATPEVSNQYNGKEWVDDLGLGMNDYGARWYDPATARWSSVDPLAEKARGWTPYRYGFNNPLVFIDPDGRWEKDAKGNLVAEKNDNAYSFAKYLNTNVETAINMLADQGYSVNEDVILNLKEGDVFNVENITSAPESRKDLGFMGNQIRKRAGSDFSKNMFENYWNGEDDVELSSQKFAGLLMYIKENNPEISKVGIIGLKGSSGKIYPGSQNGVNLYVSNEYSNVFGRATLYTNSKGNIVGLYDFYDFDPKSWGVRSTEAEIKTRMVKYASPNSAKPFSIRYGYSKR